MKRIYRLNYRHLCGSSNCVVIAKDVYDAKLISINEFVPQEEWTKNSDRIDVVELGISNNNLASGIYCICYTQY